MSLKLHHIFPKIIHFLKNFHENCTKFLPENLFQKFIPKFLQYFLKIFPKFIGNHKKLFNKFLLIILPQFFLRVLNNFSQFLRNFFNNYIKNSLKCL